MTEQNKVNKIQVSVPIGGRLVNIIYDLRIIQSTNLVECTNEMLAVYI